MMRFIPLEYGATRFWFIGKKKTSDHIYKSRNVNGKRDTKTSRAMSMLDERGLGRWGRLRSSIEREIKHDSEAYEH